MAPPSDDDRPDSTPVPPRGGKRKPNRPTGKVPDNRATGKSAANRGGGSRPAENRRATIAQQKRRRQTWIAAGAIVVVIAVVGVIVGINLSGGGAKSNTAVGAVSQDSLDSFTGSVTIQQMANAADNYSLTSNSGAYPQPASDKAITTSGKPELLYIGAEYCPYCATERWPLVLALSKFGTFKNLSSIHSSATDVYPNTATFSFYKSTYSSPYLTFTPVEYENVQEKPLQKLTAAQKKILDTYDVSGSSSGSIPFVYFNGEATIIGAEYNPQLLQGKSFQEIADSIEGGTTPLASGVIADAGAIVSEICHMTGGKGPAGVCKLFPKQITS